MNLHSLRQIVVITIISGLFVPTALSQTASRSSVSVVRLQRKLTSGGHIAHGGGVSLSHDMAPWLSVGVDAEAAHSSYHDPISLLVLDGRWNDRTQVEIGANALVAPVRIRALGAEHRLGIATGPALRWKDEQVQVSSFVEVINDETAQWRLDQVELLTSRWEAAGDDHIVVAVQHDGSPSTNYPDFPPEWNKPGTIYGLVLHDEGVDLGWTAGLDYEVRHDRLAAGFRAGYTRYRNQRMIVGSHSVDLAIRVGYRF